MILDTDFLIALREDDEGAREFAAELERSSRPKRVPSIVVEELYVGVGAGEDRTANAATYEALLANESVVPLDGNIARRAGRLEGKHLTSDDKPNLGPADAIVAATGLAHSEPVATRDGDLASVDDLTIERF